MNSMHWSARQASHLTYPPKALSSSSYRPAGKIKPAGRNAPQHHFFQTINQPADSSVPAYNAKAPYRLPDLAWIDDDLLASNSFRKGAYENSGLDRIDHFSDRARRGTWPRQADFLAIEALYRSRRTSHQPASARPNAAASCGSAARVTALTTAAPLTPHAITPGKRSSEIPPIATTG